MTKPNVNKTNIATNVPYIDNRTKQKYKSKEFINNFKQMRCINQQKVSVIFAVDIMEKYFKEI